MRELATKWTQYKRVVNISCTNYELALRNERQMVTNCLRLVDAWSNRWEEEKREHRRTKVENSVYKWSVFGASLAVIIFGVVNYKPR